MTPPRFPHSDIRGSRPACGSPRLFVACHVLPRFPAPRHPPFALSSLTTTSVRRGPRLSLASLRSSENDRLATLKSDSDSVVKEPRAPSCDARGFAVFARPGGDDRIRTGDPLLAKQVLSQLSYIPARDGGGPSWDRTRDLALIKRAL